MKQLHWKKCLMAVAIAFAGVLGAASFGPTGMTAKAADPGTEESPYEIDSKEKLEYFLQEFSESNPYHGETSHGTYGILMADITYDTGYFLLNTKVLDLNGKTLSGSYDQIISVSDSTSTLTIKDSGNGGAIINNKTDSAAPTVKVSSGAFILDSGTIGGISEYGITVDGGTVTINGGKVDGANYSICAFGGITNILGDAVISKDLVVTKSGDSTGNINISEQAKINGNLIFGGFGTITLSGGYYTLTKSQIENLNTTAGTDYVIVNITNYEYLEGTYTFGSTTYNTRIMPKDDVHPSFCGHSVVLTGQIGLVFYVDLPAGRATYGDSYVTFDGNNHKITGSVSTPATPTQGTMYAYTIYLSSIEMADDITPTFHYVENETEKEEVGDPYSVEDYIIWAVGIGRSKLTDKELAVVRALADYGFYAQQYLARVNEWEIGTDHAAMSTAFTNYYTDSDITEVAQNYEIERPLDLTKVTEIKYALKLGSSISIILYLVPVDGVTIDSVTVDGSPVSTTLSGERYVVTIPNIEATNLMHMYEVEVGTKTIKVSPMSYVYDGIRYDTIQADGKKAVSAIFYYARACTAYIQ